MFTLKIPAFHLPVSIFFANIVFMFHASFMKGYCMMESLNLIYRKSFFQLNGFFISFVFVHLSLIVQPFSIIIGDNNIGTGYPLFYNDCCYAAEWR